MFAAASTTTWRVERRLALAGALGVDPHLDHRELARLPRGASAPVPAGARRRVRAEPAIGDEHDALDAVRGGAANATRT